MTKELEVISNESRNEIDHWINKFPKDQKQSAIIPSLMIVQKQNGGHLTVELMDAVASYLNVPRISIYEVATFYSMFEHKKVGKNHLNVCTNISCLLRGSEEIVDHLKEKLDIDYGQVSSCGKFSIKPVECLGACINAPVMQVGDNYYENLTKEKIDSILDEMKNN